MKNKGGSFPYTFFLEKKHISEQEKTISADSTISKI